MHIKLECFLQTGSFTVLMNQRRYSNVGTNPAARAVYIRCAIGVRFGESQWKQNVTFMLSTVFAWRRLFYIHKLTLNVSWLSKSSVLYLSKSFCKTRGMRLMGSATDKPGIAVRSSRFAASSWWSLLLFLWMFPKEHYTIIILIH